MIVANTSFFSTDGDEITDRYSIIINYAKGLFWIDLLSTIPFEYISGLPDGFNLIAIVKVQRLVRLSGFINKSGFDEKFKSLLRIFVIIL